MRLKLAVLNALRSAGLWGVLYALGLGVVIAFVLVKAGGAATTAPICNPRAVAEQILINERPQMGGIERSFWLDVMAKHFEPRGISVSLAAALGGQESKFRPHLVSPAGARGAWQVMPNIWVGTAECAKGMDLFEVEGNAGCASRILARYVHEGRSVEAGLRRYAAGPHGQSKAQWYANEVMARLARATEMACPAAKGLYLVDASDKGGRQ
jgi:soluble lytic murein transglycosylase-like protein